MDNAVLIGCVGMQGAGKTLCMTQLVRAYARVGTPVRIYDQWCAFPGHVYASVGAYRSAVTQTGEAAMVAVFRPAVPGKTAAGTKLALDVAALVDEEGGLLVIDELHQVVPSRGDLDEHLSRVALAGRRHPEAGMIWGSQRPVHVHPEIRSQFTRLYVFRMADELDLDWVEAVRPGGSAIVDEVASLPNLDAFVLQRMGGDARPVRIRLSTDASDFAGRERR